MNAAYDEFHRIVWSYYEAYGRHDLPWRLPGPNGSLDPYKILVSEIMLQQTQVSRVIVKYEAFLQAFPTVHALAAAPLGAVLIAWQGLGYNRRAKFLWETAKIVIQEYQGIFPQTCAELVSLPGIGTNTAGAMLAYAYDEPTVFVETNIRTVFIHHFFHDLLAVPDKEVLQIVSDALPTVSEGAYTQAGQYRSWYWALMDYGTHLKQTIGNISRASKTYTKQSTFNGSVRQVRGKVLRLLAEGFHTQEQLITMLADDRTMDVLHRLTAEGMIRSLDGAYELP
jgi:A/G-specific adenine glycosylase